MNSYNAYKSSQFSSVKHSSYFDVYDLLFQSYVGKPITFLEIGVQNGGSLFMWREFFGPQARIIGVDLNPEVVVWREHGFEIYIGSQSDSKFWESLVNEVGPIDIVLDDGGHTFLQQITTVESLVSAITPDGLIVVEDTHTSYMKEFSPKTGSTFIDYAFSIIHGINYRFGAFGTSYEKAVYSIQFFESIVAFRINSEKCIKSSSSINNENIIGYDSRDYRYGDSITFTSTKYKNLYIKLKRIPLVYSLLKNIYLAIKKSSNRRLIKRQIRFIHKKF